MANAKKCDRCGALYEMPKCNPILSIKKDLHPYEPIQIDLCPHCYKTLENWLEYKEKKEGE